MDMNNKKVLTRIIALVGSCFITGMAAASVESTTSYTYNSLGLMESIDGPRVDVSDITTFGYDAQGNRTSITNTLSQVTQITAYDASGRPLTIVDPNEVTTQLTYDPRGRLLTRTTAGQTTK
jgi:YD repeat-containing protein